MRLKIPILEIVLMLLTVALMVFIWETTASSDIQKIKIPSENKLEPKFIVIHHTVTPNGKEYSLEQCNRDHKLRGFDSCGYSWLIGPSGNIIESRGFDKIGAHTQGHNREALGIAIVGNGEVTTKQLNALRSLVEICEKRFGKLELHAHRDFKATECPSEKIWRAVKETLNAE